MSSTQKMKSWTKFFLDRMLVFCVGPGEMCQVSPFPTTDELIDKFIQQKIANSECLVFSLFLVIKPRSNISKLNITSCGTGLPFLANFFTPSFKP